MANQLVARLQGLSHENFPMAAGGVERNCELLRDTVNIFVSARGQGDTSGTRLLARDVQCQPLGGLMSEPSPRGILNQLIESCRDAERGFVHAGELVKDPDLKRRFAEDGAKRAEFAGDLTPYAERLGGFAAAEGTAAASIHRHWMDLRNSLSGHDDRAILTEVRRGDQLTLQAFKTAKESLLPPTVRDVVERIYDEVLISHRRLEELAADVAPGARAQ